MSKIAIITWVSFFNYGTMLQAFALQRFIESLGHKSVIIDDSYIQNQPSESSCQTPNRFEGWSVRLEKLLKSFNPKYRSFYKFQRILCPSILNFKKQHLHIESDCQGVLRGEKQYDVFVCGSDQIWWPENLMKRANEYYFASFAKCKKIAYAPSLGLYAIPENWKSKMSSLLSDFSAIAMREDAGTRAIKEITNKEVITVVDPTLLLSEYEWNSCLAPTSASEDYVLAYILSPNDRYYQIAQDFAKQQGLKLYLFMLNPEDYGKTDMLISGGPFDFLSMVKNAKFVFTDSYHGTIFSIIFKRQFITFRRMYECVEESHNSRIETLLMAAGLVDRYLNVQEDEISLDFQPIDYTQVYCNLNPHIERSKTYLSNALS